MNTPTQTTATPRQQQVVLWVLWGAFVIGVVMFRVFLARPLPPGATPSLIPWPALLAPVLVSVGIRWLMLPRAQHVIQAMPLMIVGLAMAEVTCTFSIFLRPSHPDLLYGASVLGVLQFAPVWARRFFPAPGKPPVENLVPRPPR